MHTFGERLRGSLTISGDSTPERLSQLAGIHVTTARLWLKKDTAQNICSDTLCRLCVRLNLRAVWVGLGVGSPAVIRLSTDAEARAMGVIGQLEGAALEQWLSDGEGKPSRERRYER